MYTKYLTDRGQRLAFIETHKAMEHKKESEKEYQRTQKLLDSSKLYSIFLKNKQPQFPPCCSSDFPHLEKAKKDVYEINNRIGEVRHGSCENPIEFKCICFSLQKKILQNILNLFTKQNYSFRRRIINRYIPFSHFVTNMSNLLNGIGNFQFYAKTYCWWYEVKWYHAKYILSSPHLLPTTPSTSVHILPEKKQ